MKSYFLSKSIDGNVTQIDDSYKSMQLMKTVVGQAEHKYINNEHYYYIHVGDDGAKDLIWGYGLDELDGCGRVGLQIERVDDSTLGVRLVKSVTYNWHDMWSYQDDTIMNEIVFYGFKNIYNEPASDSLVGFEVYKDDGSILYTTKRKILNIIYMASATSHTEDYNDWQNGYPSIYLIKNSPTITYRKTGVLIPIGAYFDIQRSVISSICTIGVNVNQKSTKVYGADLYCTSRNRRPTPYSDLHFNTFGGIFAEI